MILQDDYTVDIGEAVLGLDVCKIDKARIQLARRWISPWVTT